MCLFFFRHETLRQGLIRTIILNVISTPTKYTCVYYYIICILKDLSIKLYMNGIFIHVSQLHWIISHIKLMAMLDCTLRDYQMLQCYSISRYDVK